MTGVYNSILLQFNNSFQEEDEWREFEEKETDYSGLKIQNLQIRYVTKHETYLPCH